MKKYLLGIGLILALIACKQNVSSLDEKNSVSVDLPGEMNVLVSKEKTRRQVRSNCNSRQAWA